MLFTTFKIGDKEYKLRLTTGAMIELEGKLGKNPLTLIADVSAKNVLPKMSEAMLILHYAMIKFQPKQSLKDTYSLYDDYVDAGNTYGDLICVLVDALSVSGYFRKKEQGADTEKN